MLEMRERLISSNHAQQAHELGAINQHIVDASALAAALTKLESTQDQLRTLQATLVAERVARTQMERRSHEGEDDVRDVRNELAGAVRALRRAKEEAKKNEEEKRRLAKCFEETKVQ
jgi:septal ring factor EnvC (AmiA/AmiB activator)